MTRILLIGHYPPDKQESMTRYGQMLADGFRDHGYTTIHMDLNLFFGRFYSSPTSLGKWIGYLDKFIVFPFKLKREIARMETAKNSYIVCIPDHSHGIYLHWLKRKPHIIHCHDLLAIRSALGEIPENPTSWTGRIYQKLILSGLRKGRNFISVSHATDQDLRTLLEENSGSSESRRFHVAWNGLNYPFHPIETEVLSDRLQALREKFNLTSAPYFLHVGGNQWYKNRPGVLRIFLAYCRKFPSTDFQLILAGKPPNENLQALAQESDFKGRIHFLTGASDEEIHTLCAGATCFLFPSLIEGFGWPIAEAMACGTPVLTTDKPPMTEVGGKTAFYIPPMPQQNDERESWAEVGAESLQRIVDEVIKHPQKIREKAVQCAQRFDPKDRFRKILSVYQKHTEELEMPPRSGIQ